ncbi:DoxX family protein [Mucilaginibacter sp. BJC16-A38]|uniref:DoxX family protein n=1 Tax=Mucilaginibacter phenanthrenivorans TaxID=1234842 RepID=UPI0021588292|nr:DoxX family protein [Mucilaginibacter phenanthrenivorans]MCR8557488.1 DoxX family protein [Mucilaginibacter phenanthrenivorans]
MKAIKITYWVTTSIIGLMMIYSAYAYLTQAAVAQGFVHLGFPSYFRVELAIAKLIGAILILTPLSARIKEWAYAGFTITFVSAFIAHTASGDPVSRWVMPVIFLVVLAVSYYTYNKLPKKI